MILCVTKKRIKEIGKNTIIHEEKRSGTTADVKELRSGYRR